jgi:hypothetical protein
MITTALSGDIFLFSAANVEYGEYPILCAGLLSESLGCLTDIMNLSIKNSLKHISIYHRPLDDRIILDYCYVNPKELRRLKLN